MASGARARLGPGEAAVRGGEYTNEYEDVTLFRWPAVKKEKNGGLHKQCRQKTFKSDQIIVFDLGK